MWGQGEGAILSFNTLQPHYFMRKGLENFIAIHHENIVLNMARVPISGERNVDKCTILYNYSETQYLSIIASPFLRINFFGKQTRDIILGINTYE